jgi:hypothetical protein
VLSPPGGFRNVGIEFRNGNVGEPYQVTYRADKTYTGLSRQTINVRTLRSAGETMKTVVLAIIRINHSMCSDEAASQKKKKKSKEGYKWY